MVTGEQYEAQKQALNVEALLKDARAEAGLTDFGDESFLIALQKVSECYAHDANFHRQGLENFRQRFQADLKKHPEILDEDVTDPMLIIGNPRCGTTKMHRMIGADTRLLKTYTWQLVNPAPFPDAKPGEPDPRIAAVENVESLLEDNAVRLAGKTRAHDIRLGHFWGAWEVQEDCQLLGFTFNDDYQRITRVPSPSFRDWVRERTEPSNADNYKYLYSLFQYLQWQQGGKQGRKWVMKNTGHPAHLDEMMAIHPNASLMHVHRDPRVSIASMARLGRAIWSTRIQDIDPKFCGRYYSGILKWNIDRYLEARDRLKLDDRFVDVPYQQIRTNPIPYIREFYARSGYEYTAEAEQQQRTWDADNEEGKYGKHTYDLDEFGLSKKQIERDFGEYIERFIETAELKAA